MTAATQVGRRSLQAPATRSPGEAAPATAPAPITKPPDVFTLPAAGEFASESTLQELAAVLGQQGPHVTLPREQVERMSFSELAAADLPALLDNVRSELQRVGRQTAPDDANIRPVRKSMERLRNNLDLFASVYPPGGEHGWKALRARVDEVYESLGELKDLHDSGLQAHASLGWDATPSDADAATKKLQLELLPERQERVAAAKDALLNDVDAFKAMLASPTKTPKHEKQHGKDDSRFYWGGVKAQPKGKDSGLGNIRRLLHGQVDVARKTSKGVLDLDDPIGTKREKEFHDFRKRVRSLINVASYFPEVFKEPARGVELQRKLYSLVYEYGQIEDRLVRARTAAALGDPKDRAAAEAEVRELWPQLVQWQKDQKIDGVLKEYSAELAS